MPLPPTLLPLRCNSSLAAVLDYLACPAVASRLRAFVERLPGYPATRARLLLFTDERDASYLEALLGALNAMPLWRGRAVGVTRGPGPRPGATCTLFSGRVRASLEAVAMPGGLVGALPFPLHRLAPPGLERAHTHRPGASGLAPVRDRRVCCVHPGAPCTPTRSSRAART